MPGLIYINESRDSSALPSGIISCLSQNRFVLLLANEEAQRKGRACDQFSSTFCV